MTGVKKPVGRVSLVLLYSFCILLSREEALARKARGSQGQ